jgi:uroporphyrinogen-III synthase
MPSDLVVLTRRESDNEALARALEARGLRCLSYPCIATRPVPPDEATLRDLASGGTLAAIAFTSRSAVEALFDQPAIGARLALCDVPILGAVGPATASALAARHRPPDLVADPATGAALAAAFACHLSPKARVLLPGGDKPRPELPEGLRAAGLVPLPLPVYGHVAVTPAPLPLPPPGVIVCASPSAATAFLRANPGLTACPFVAIGPTTAQALGALGATRVTRAAATTTDALVDAVLAAR